MPDYGNYNEGGGGGTLLPVGEHPCKIASVTITTGKKYQSDEEQEQYKWEFHSLTRKDAEGAPEIITCWTGVDYGNEKANLTLFVNSVFGRHLTKAEWRALDLERMVGIKGMVYVASHTKTSGVKTVKFGSWRNPDGRPVPSPDQFEGASAMQPSAPMPKSVTAEEEAEDFGFEDPFAEDSPETVAARNGKGKSVRSNDSQLGAVQTALNPESVGGGKNSG